MSLEILCMRKMTDACEIVDILQPRSVNWRHPAGVKVLSDPGRSSITSVFARPELRSLS